MGAAQGGEDGDLALSPPNQQGHTAVGTEGRL